MKAGVAISPDTPSTAITDEVGKAADMLLVMTVYPGALILPSEPNQVQLLMHRYGMTVNGREGRPEIPRSLCAQGLRTA